MFLKVSNQLLKVGQSCIAKVMLQSLDIILELIRIEPDLDKQFRQQCMPVLNRLGNCLTLGRQHKSPVRLTLEIAAIRQPLDHQGNAGAN